MKLHVYFFLFGHHICLFATFDVLSQVPLHRIPHCDIFFLFGYHICLFAAFDFLSQVPFHRIPHCDIVRSMIIIKISS